MGNVSKLISELLPLVTNAKSDQATAQIDKASDLACTINSMLIFLRFSINYMTIF